MCLSSHPSIPQDNSAKLAAQQADQRQAQVTQGQQNIDAAFTPFNDDYFNKYQQTYEDNYNPQVDDQYKLAQQKERYNEARSGMLDSTPAIFQQDQLNKSYGQQRQTIAGNAINATDVLKNSVQQQKAQLYSLNSSAADPTLASTQAAAAAGTIPSTPQYSMLGDLFSGLVNSTSAVAAGNSQNNPYFTPNRGLPGGPLPSGSGSGRVVS